MKPLGDDAVQRGLGTAFGVDSPRRDLLERTS